MFDVTCNIASNVSEKFTTPSHVNSIKSQYTKKFLITRLKSPRKFLTLSIHIILFDKKYVYIGLGREPGGDLGSTRGSGKGCDRWRRRVRAWQLRRTCRSCRRRPRSAAIRFGFLGRNHWPSGWSCSFGRTTLTWQGRGPGCKRLDRNGCFCELFVIGIFESVFIKKLNRSGLNTFRTN